MPLSSRKEDRMKKSTIQKEKIDNVGIHSFSKKSNFFFTLLLTLVGFDLCSFPSSSLSRSLWQTNKVWQSMASNSGQQNLDLMVTSSWYSSKTKSCKPSSLPCLDHCGTACNVFITTTYAYAISRSTFKYRKFFTVFSPLVCSLVQGWFQATLSPLNSCS